MRRCLDSAWTNAAPPWAMISPPGSALRTAISVARSPRAMRVPAHPAAGSVAENTTLGSLFMNAA